jgi:hypothetical protein
MIIEDTDIMDYIGKAKASELADMLVSSLPTWTKVIELIKLIQDQLPESYR